MTTKIQHKLIDASELEHWIVWNEVKNRTEARFQDSLLATGSPHRAAKETERFLEGNALFEIDEDGCFEATVGTQSGVKYFSGVDAESVSSEAYATCRSLDKQITRSFDALPPLDALRTIGYVWNLAERTCELAAARSRLLLGKLPKLQSASLPEWFEDAVADWDDEDRGTLNPASLEAVKQIVAYIAHEFPDLRAEVTVGMLGRVTVDWYAESVRCSWMVEATDLPFPTTRIYEALQVPQGRVQTRIIHDMYSALNALREIVSGSHGN